MFVFMLAKMISAFFFFTAALLTQIVMTVMKKKEIKVMYFILYCRGLGM